jgi:NAD-specific glutamate dehydrogenase
MLDMSLSEISCKIQLTFLPWTDSKKQDIYRIDTVHYNVNDVDYHIDEARHATLYKMLSPVIKGQVKKQVKDQLEEKTRTMLEQFQLQLNNLTTRAKLMYEERLKAGMNEERLLEDDVHHPW